MMMMMMWALALGGMARGDESAQVERLLALVDRQNESLRLSVERERETVEKMERQAEAAEAVNEKMEAAIRDLRKAYVAGYLERLRGQAAKAKMTRLALEVMEEALTSGEARALRYLAEAAKCLDEEVTLRKEWRVWAKGKMTRKHREEIGRQWVAMSECHDVIAEVVKRYEKDLPSGAMERHGRREEAQSWPAVPEPEMVEE